MGVNAMLSLDNHPWMMLGITLAICHWCTDAAQFNVKDQKLTFSTFLKVKRSMTYIVL